MTIRVLALSEQPVSYDGNRYHSKESGFYNRLAERVELIGVETTTLTGLQELANKALAFQPNIERWRQGSAINPHAFDRRTKLAEQKIAPYEGQYDVIIQWHTQFAPGTNFRERPYAITLDNTVLNSERYWPDWVPFRTSGEREGWLEREHDTYHHAQYIFPWSEFTRRSLIEDYDMPPERVIVANPGFNFTTIPPLQQDKEPVPKALFVGYEFERKGGKVLLEAWRKVIETVPDAVLTVVGPPRDNAPLPKGVVWRGRISDRDEVRRLYEEAAVFVMPSLFEPWGHVFLEAMGFGLPCVGVDAFAMPEFIDHGETGYRAPLGDADAVANYLIELFQQPERAQAMGRKAHERVQTMTWDSMLDVVLSHLQKEIA